MPARRVGVKQVELRSEGVSRLPANSVEVEAESRLPHDLARARHYAESDIDWGDDRDAAANASRIRAHVRGAEIDAELVLGTAHARRCGTPLRMRRRRERHRKRRQNHPAEELLHNQN